MTEIVESLSKMRSIRKKIGNKTVGFVPTMGALHAGHEELLKLAGVENDIAIMSIYANPTQFDNKEDLEKYPNTLKADIRLAEKKGFDYAWLPQYEQIYPDQYKYKVQESDFSKTLCGAHRPGHFDGMLTIVMKLLNVTKPTKAYFGEKDYQQLQLVKGMVDTFFLDTKIVAVPTVREESGLAMSSRNVRLTPEEKKLAPFLYKTLKSAANANEAKAELEKNGFKVEYVEDLPGRRLAAAHLGSVRLIDNVEL